LIGLAAIDTCIALLLLVGRTETDLLSRHKKLKSIYYDEDSFYRLEALISQFSGVVFYLTY
jgi:hypothetical protein